MPGGVRCEWRVADIGEGREPVAASRGFGGCERTSQGRLGKEGRAGKAGRRRLSRAAWRVVQGSDVDMVGRVVRKTGL